MRIQLQNGQVCMVKIRGQVGIRRRIFKWTEKRFGSLPCYVFSAPCRPDVRVVWNATKRSLTVSGSRVPASEVSVPEYDIELCERVMERKVD